ncbi:transposase [bacterium]|nr:transposase [bacterium]
MLARVMSGETPQYLRSDNGPSSSPRRLDLAVEAGVETHHIDPGSPWQNPSGRANGRLRDECLNLNCSRIS